ncbi:unnamed protein product [Amoebophrya sp. A120]|nr:unnamed protein product [Amoebophrya sp. A120]|eukprot:GSA120T00003008001.1
MAGTPGAPPQFAHVPAPSSAVPQQPVFGAHPGKGGVLSPAPPVAITHNGYAVPQGTPLFIPVQNPSTGKVEMVQLNPATPLAHPPAKGSQAQQLRTKMLPPAIPSGSKSQAKQQTPQLQQIQPPQRPAAMPTTLVTVSKKRRGNRQTSGPMVPPGTTGSSRSQLRQPYQTGPVAQSPAFVGNNYQLLPPSPNYSAQHQQQQPQRLQQPPITTIVAVRNQRGKVSSKRDHQPALPVSKPFDKNKKKVHMLTDGRRSKRSKRDKHKKKRKPPRRKKKVSQEIKDKILKRSRRWLQILRRADRRLPSNVLPGSIVTRYHHEKIKRRNRKDPIPWAGDGTLYFNLRTWKHWDKHRHRYVPADVWWRWWYLKATRKRVCNRYRLHWCPFRLIEQQNQQLSLGNKNAAAVPRPPKQSKEQRRKDRWKKMTPQQKQMHAVIRRIDAVMRRIYTESGSKKTPRLFFREQFGPVWERAWVDRSADKIRRWNMILQHYSAANAVGPNPDEAPVPLLSLLKHPDIPVKFLTTGTLGDVLDNTLAETFPEKSWAKPLLGPGSEWVKGGRGVATVVDDRGVLKGSSSSRADVQKKDAEDHEHPSEGGKDEVTESEKTEQPSAAKAEGGIKTSASCRADLEAAGKSGKMSDEEVATTGGEKEVSTSAKGDGEDSGSGSSKKDATASLNAKNAKNRPTEWHGFVGDILWTLLEKYTDDVTRETASEEIRQRVEKLQKRVPQLPPEVWLDLKMNHRIKERRRQMAAGAQEKSVDSAVEESDAEHIIVGPPDEDMKDPGASEKVRMRKPPSRARAPAPLVFSESAFPSVPKQIAPVKDDSGVEKPDLQQLGQQRHADGEMGGARSPSPPVAQHREVAEKAKPTRVDINRPRSILKSATEQKYAARRRKYEEKFQRQYYPRRAAAKPGFTPEDISCAENLSSEDDRPSAWGPELRWRHRRDLDFLWRNKNKRFRVYKRKRNRRKMLFKTGWDVFWEQRLQLEHARKAKARSEAKLKEKEERKLRKRRVFADEADLLENWCTVDTEHPAARPVNGRTPGLQAALRAIRKREAEKKTHAYRRKVAAPPSYVHSRDPINPNAVGEEWRFVSQAEREETRFNMAVYANENYYEASPEDWFWEQSVRDIRRKIRREKKAGTSSREVVEENYSEVEPPAGLPLLPTEGDERKANAKVTTTEAENITPAAVIYEISSRGCEMTEVYPVASRRGKTASRLRQHLSSVRARDAVASPSFTPQNLHYEFDPRTNTTRMRLQ